MPAGVVGDRPEGVKRDDQACQREQAHDGDADAVDAGHTAAGELPCAKHAQDDHDGRKSRRLQARREALDDVRGVARDGRFGRLLDRIETGRGVIFRQSEQQRRHRDADQRAQVQVPPFRRVDGIARLEESQVAHQPVGDRREHRSRDDARHGKTLKQGALDVLGLGPNRVGPDDRGDDRRAPDDQRVQGHPGRLVECQDAQQDHGDCGHRVGLEQVGRHAGAVADVVTDVVGDRRRVTRVILGDARLDLPDQVGTDVCRLGEDPAAQTGEDGDQRATEAQADQRVDGGLGAVVEERGQRPVVARDAKQGEADDQHSGDRAAAEGDLQRRRDA